MSMGLNCDRLIAHLKEYDAKWNCTHCGNGLVSENADCLRPACGEAGSRAMSTLQRAAESAEMALSLLVEHGTVVGGSTVRALAGLRDAIPTDTIQRDSYEQAIQDAETYIKMLEGALRWIRDEAETGTDRHEACDSIYGACDAALGDSEEVYE